MSIERLLTELVRGAVRTRRRRRGVTRLLTGRRRGSLVGMSTLIGAAGLAWGAFETWQRGQGAPAAGGDGAPPPEQVVPPPLPGSPGEAVVPPEALRLVRLAISAARADGELAPEESARILEHARRAGAEALVQRELDRPIDLAQIVAGIGDPDQKRQLYVLAYAIVHSDERLTGAERIYLARLAHLLELSPAEAARLEAEAHEQIEAAEQEGDPDDEGPDEVGAR